MIDQLTLHLEPLEPVPASRLSIDERFDLFHQANPHVYRALVTLTRELTSRGRSRVGMGMLFEQLRWRWQTTTTTDPTSDYRLNHDYRSRYARLIMIQEPDLDGVYETRGLRS